jgi:hypothetical protein
VRVAPRSSDLDTPTKYNTTPTADTNKKGNKKKIPFFIFVSLIVVFEPFV